MEPRDDSEPLADVRAKRGYLLPHHGLMATVDPELLRRYDQLYQALALTDRRLSAHDREFVWLAILIAKDESLAKHHLDKFMASGGTRESVDAVTALTALARGAAAYGFVARHWSTMLGDYETRKGYDKAFLAASLTIEPRLAHLGALAAHTCCGNWDVLGWQIRSAYRDEVPEPEIAEAIVATTFPSGVPNVVRASRVWQTLIRDRDVDASVPFRDWATLPEQDGHAGTAFS